MKKTITLTESELSFLIRRIVKEQVESETTKSDDISLIQNELNIFQIKLNTLFFYINKSVDISDFKTL
jgi:hypothetical protein